MKYIIICLTLSAWLMMACQGVIPTPIRSIIDNPRDYHGKTVSVSGEVNEIFSLIVIKYFVVKDDTGEILVVTQNPLPRKGVKIRVKGTVNELFSLGENQALVIVEEKDSN